MRSKTEIKWEIEELESDIKHYKELKKMYEGRGVTHHEEYTKICETVIEYKAKLKVLEWVLEEE